MAWDQPVLLAILNAHPDHHERVSCLISRFVDISHLIDVFDILLMEVFHKADLVSGRVQKALRNPVGLSLESLNLDAGTEVDWLTLRATLSAAVLPKATQLQRVTLWILGVSSLLSTGLYFISSIKHYLSGVDRRCYIDSTQRVMLVQMQTWSSHALLLFMPLVSLVLS